MAFTTLFSSPTVALSVGPFGPVVSGPVASTINQLQVQFDLSAWPVGGSDVLQAAIDESNDGGTTWFDNLKFTIPGGPILEFDPVTRTTSPATVSKVSCTLLFPGIAQAQHRLRARGNVLRAVTTGVVVLGQ